MAYIERAITPVLKKRVSSSKCLLLTGARQVGKSTLVKHVFPAYHRANFDDRLTSEEECMADNFGYTLAYGMDGPKGDGYPNPEIIEGIMDFLCRR